MSDPTTGDACIKPTVTRLPCVGSSTEFTWLRTPDTVTAAKRRELVSAVWSASVHTVNRMQMIAGSAMVRPTENA